MIIYRRKQSVVLRYTIAIVVFTLGLTLTVVDVYGLQLPFAKPTDKSITDNQNKQLETTDDSARDTEFSDIILNDDCNSQETDSMPPTSVPEPSTIILLASGLGLFRIAHRKKH